MLRELNKAYVGFFDNNDSEANNLPVNTGKWGCGVFGGDLHLKTLLQWVVASECGRNMIFYLSGDRSMEDFGAIIQKFQDVSVGKLMQYICTAAENKGNARLFDILINL